MIDTTKFPFKIDHTKCLNCQMVENKTDGMIIDGSTWQKGTHLCSSCQWHCAMLALDTRVESIIKSELRRIEGVTSGYGYSIYFDETTPEQALEELLKIRIEDNPDLTDAIESLKQIIELGYKNRLVC